MSIYGERLQLGDRVYSLGIRKTHSQPNDAGKGTWYSGIQARTRFMSGLGMEGSIDYRRNTYKKDTEIVVYPVQLSLLGYLMPQSRLSPYLLGGTGWYYTRIKNISGFNDARDRYGFHAGAGFEWMIKDVLYLDSSFRYVWLHGVLAKDSNRIENLYQDKGSMITLALNYLF